MGGGDSGRDEASRCLFMLTGRLYGAQLSRYQLEVQIGMFHLAPLTTAK